MAGKRVNRNAGGQMTKRRKQFEAANPQRYQTGQDLIPGARNLSNAQLSRAMGWHESHNDNASASPGAVNPRQGVLFEHPHTIDNPPHWEDLAPEHQQQTLAAAANYGATPETMKRAYSSQVQRGLMRDPNHASFYEQTGTNEAGEHLPKSRLLASAQQTGTPPHVNAVANAVMSPNMHFILTKKSGEVTYPNDDEAKGAIRLSQAGMTGEEYVKGFVSQNKGGAGYPLQGYPDNAAKAIDATTKLAAGATVREAWKPKSAPGTGGSDKTRPYYNALVVPDAPEGNFLVSDTHTGGGGMAPHLADTPDEDKYLKIPGIHALHDHVARQVAAEHGISSVSRMQSLQWNQEKLETDASSMSGAHSVEAMHPVNPNVSQRQRAEAPGQGTLF